MSKTVEKPSSDETEVAELVICEFNRHLEKPSLPLPLVPRAAVVGAQIHAGRSLEEANRAITVAHRSGAVAQVRGGDQLYLTDPELSAETLLEELREYLERIDEPDSGLVGAINARRQELRDGGDA
ncbi:hypothetical protein [Natrinema pallidum]|uniref:hypothetical protein n=1 Tax=Natrinema pallidum TaxID=69527 RepID=UPI003753488E